LLKATTSLFTHCAPDMNINPLNAEINPIRHLLVMAGAHHFVDVSRIRINYKNTQISKVSRTNLLGLTLDSTHSWKPHTDHLVSKLNSACFVIRSLKPIIPLETLRMIYFFQCSFHYFLWHNILE
jgi:hypothetical protein